MPKVLLTTPYPTIEETARMLGISAKERDDIVARVAVKAEALRARLRKAQEGKDSGTRATRLKRDSAVGRTKPAGTLTREFESAVKAAGTRGVGSKRRPRKTNS